MEVVGYGGLFVSVGITMIQVLKNYYSLCSKYQRLDELPVKTPSLLVNEIEQDLSTHLASYGLSFLRKNQVLIEGIVSSNTPIKSIMEPSIDLLYSVAYKKDIHQRRVYSKNTYFPRKLPNRHNTQTRIASGFFLKDYETDKICEIQKKAKMNIEGALEILSVNTHLITSGFFEQALRSIIELVRLLLSLLYIKIKYLKKKGAYEGYINVEQGLKLNSIVTAFGDVIYDVHNKKLVMENPMYILQDKTQLLKIMKANIKCRRIMVIALSIPLLLGGGMFLKKLGEFTQNYLRSKKEKLICHIRKRMNELSVTKYLSDEQKCNVCYDNVRNIILKPCLHMCLCHECLQRIRKQECPICKSEIVSTIEVFVK